MWPKDEQIAFICFATPCVNGVNGSYRQKPMMCYYYISAEVSFLSHLPAEIIFQKKGFF